jgi:hypothetical protein
MPVLVDGNRRHGARRVVTNVACICNRRKIVRTNITAILRFLFLLCCESAFYSVLRFLSYTCAIH